VDGVDAHDLLTLLKSASADRQHRLAAAGTAGRSAEDSPLQDLETLQRIRALFQRAGVFEKAEKLIEKFRARAEAIADDIEPTELRELLYFLVDTVLDRSVALTPEPESLPLVQLSK
jgi:geranylgeranyl pyrophosphate synthase